MKYWQSIRGDEWWYSDNSIEASGEFDAINNEFIISNANKVRAFEDISRYEFDIFLKNTFGEMDKGLCVKIALNIFRDIIGDFRNNAKYIFSEKDNYVIIRRA